MCTQLNIATAFDKMQLSIVHLSCGTQRQTITVMTHNESSIHRNERNSTFSRTLVAYVLRDTIVDLLRFGEAYLQLTAWINRSLAYGGTAATMAEVRNREQKLIRNFIRSLTTLRWWARWSAMSYDAEFWSKQVSAASLIGVCGCWLFLCYDDEHWENGLSIHCVAKPTSRIEKKS